MRLLLLSSFLFLLISCESSQNHNSEEIFGIGVEMSESDEGFISKSVSEDISVASELNAPPPLEQQNYSQESELKIIKTATLRFESQDLEQTHAQILSIIKEAGGYVQNDNSGKNYSQLYHNLSVRIPTENFQSTLDAISKGVAHFDEKTIRRQDVTEEFIDLNARLKAKRALEDRYLALLAKAKNVKEMLDIERELSQIRETIERAEGRLKYLSNKVSLSTLNIQFYKTEIVTQTNTSFGAKMSNALKSGWNGIASFFLGLLSVWPFLILVALFAYVIRRWIQKRKKNK
tara:strand:- start:732 stop:1601 length:870 start_codon:yes stop_codon:yes gene_type:complete